MTKTTLIAVFAAIVIVLGDTGIDARITSQRGCQSVQSWLLNRQGGVEVWIEPLNCNGVPDGDTLECPVFVQRVMARGMAADVAATAPLLSGSGGRLLLEFHSVRCLWHNSQLGYPAMLQNAHTRMKAGGWILNGVIAFLQEVEDCVLSGGPPCANTTTVFTYPTFN